jgi:hypothetical protein
MRAVLPLIAAAGLLAITACAGHTYDRQAHEAALEDAGVEVRDLDAVVTAVAEVCSHEDMETAVLGMASDIESRGGDQASELSDMRIHIEQICPDQVDDFDDAVESLSGG